MPAITSKIIFSAGLLTSNNGGRKLIKLKNGNQYAVLRNSSSGFYIMKTTDNWTSQTIFYTTSQAGLIDVSLATDGKFIFLIFSYTSGYVYTRSFSENGDILSSKQLEDTTTGSTAVGNTSIIVNDAGNKVYATWTNRNSISPNSYNIRFVEGIISKDGKVTWDAVEQVTNLNVSGFDRVSPNIILDGNGIPMIFHQTLGSHTSDVGSNLYGYAIQVLKRDRTLSTTPSTIHASWSQKTIYSDSNSYPQNSPCAIFVPKSINGLLNGRIWLVWHGTDSTDALSNIRVSYSDDGGKKWSAMQKITTGTSSPPYRINASITANKRNEIFVLWTDGGTNGKSKSTNGTTWSTPVYPGAGGNPSTLYDADFDFTEPLFIYQGIDLVCFQGSWTDTKNSVPSGYLGEKYSGTILPYSISTDGTMSTITEKINDVVVATKTAIRGESLMVSLTDAQWDAIPYGRYRKMPNDLTDDFSGKVSGDLASNPHIIKESGIQATLQAPSGSWEESYNLQIDKAKILDGSLMSRSSPLVNACIAQQLFSFDLIEFIRRKYGVVVPGADIAAKVKWLKANISRITSNWHGFGSGPSGNKANFSSYQSEVNAWSGANTNTGSVPTITTSNTTSASSRIDANGFIHYLAYAEASNGTIASTINTDYINIEIQLKENAIVLENTLTIEMGTEKWTYTFNKQLTVSPELGPIVKSILDNAEVSYPAKKSLLASSIRDKGGTLSNNLVSLETMIEAVKDIPSGVKSATGTVISSSSTYSLLDVNGSSVTTFYVDIMFTDLNFIPKILFLYRKNKVNSQPSVWVSENYIDVSSSHFANVLFGGSYYRSPYSTFTDRIRVPIAGSSLEFTWIAKG